MGAAGVGVGRGAWARGPPRKTRAEGRAGGRVPRLGPPPPPPRRRRGPGGVGGPPAGSASVGRLGGYRVVGPIGAARGGGGRGAGPGRECAGTTKRSTGAGAARAARAAAGPEDHGHGRVTPAAGASKASIRARRPAGRGGEASAERGWGGVGVGASWSGTGPCAGSPRPEGADLLSRAEAPGLRSESLGPVAGAPPGPRPDRDDPRLHGPREASRTRAPELPWAVLAEPWDGGRERAARSVPSSEVATVGVAEPALGRASSGGSDGPTSTPAPQAEPQAPFWVTPPQVRAGAHGRSSQMREEGDGRGHPRLSPGRRRDQTSSEKKKKNRPSLSGTVTARVSGFSQPPYLSTRAWDPSLGPTENTPPRVPVPGV